MKYILFAVLLSIFPSVVRSVELTEVDSLLHLYDQSRSARRTAVGHQLLALFADKAIFFDDPPALEKGMPAEVQDMRVWFGAERYYLTNAYFSEALTYADRVVPLARQHDDDVLATTLCDRSYCLFKTSDYTRAIEAGQEAVRFCQKADNVMQLSRAYLYISLVNHALRYYDEAKALVVKSIETNARLGVNMQTHNALGCACEIFASARELDKAVDYGLQAVEAARELNYLPGMANHLTQLSYAYDRKGEYERGLEAANQAIDIVLAGEPPIDRNQLAISLEFKSWNLLDLKRNREAVEVIKEAIDMEQEVGNIHAAMYDYRTLCEALEPLDVSAALAAMKRYIQLSDSLHSEQLKELMSKANAEFRNDELQEQNEQGRRLTRIIVATALVIVVLLVLLAAALGFAYRQKQRTARSLRRLSEVREMFFTNVTHEFRTPLTVILGVGDELRRQSAPADLDALHASGETICRQGNQLLTLVNQLLDITKVKAATGEQAWIRGDLAAYAAMVVESHREMARQHGVELCFESYGLMETYYVADYVQKLLANLLSNAIKFTDEGGRVAVSLHRTDDILELEVADTGRGIAPSDLPHIFEPFYQAAHSDCLGTGVGLALVKQIVDTLKGKISVSSQPGCGTTFRVRLKEERRKDAQVAPTPAAVAEEPVLPPSSPPPTAVRPFWWWKTTKT